MGNTPSRRRLPLTRRRADSRPLYPQSQACNSRKQRCDGLYPCGSPRLLYLMTLELTRVLVSSDAAIVPGAASQPPATSQPTPSRPTPCPLPVRIPMRCQGSILSSGRRLVFLTGPQAPTKAFWLAAAVKLPTSTHLLPHSSPTRTARGHCSSAVIFSALEQVRSSRITLGLAFRI